MRSGTGYGIAGFTTGFMNGLNAGRQYRLEKQYRQQQYDARQQELGEREAEKKNQTYVQSVIGKNDPDYGPYTQWLNGEAVDFSGFTPERIQRMVYNRQNYWIPQQGSIYATAANVNLPEPPLVGPTVSTTATQQPSLTKSLPRPSLTITPPTLSADPVGMKRVGADLTLPALGVRAQVAPVSLQNAAPVTVQPTFDDRYNNHRRWFVEDQNKSWTFRDKKGNPLLGADGQAQRLYDPVSNLGLLPSPELQKLGPQRVNDEARQMRGALMAYLTQYPQGKPQDVASTGETVDDAPVTVQQQGFTYDPNMTVGASPVANPITAPVVNPLGDWYTTRKQQEQNRQLWKAAVIDKRRKEHETNLLVPASFTPEQLAELDALALQKYPDPARPLLDQPVDFQIGTQRFQMPLQELLESKNSTLVNNVMNPNTYVNVVVEDPTQPNGVRVVSTTPENAVKLEQMKGDRLIPYQVAGVGTVWSTKKDSGSLGVRIFDANEQHTKNRAEMGYSIDGSGNPVPEFLRKSRLTDAQIVANLSMPGLRQAQTNSLNYETSVVKPFEMRNTEQRTDILRNNSNKRGGTKTPTADDLIKKYGTADPYEIDYINAYKQLFTMGPGSSDSSTSIGGVELMAGASAADGKTVLYHGVPLRDVDGKIIYRKSSAPLTEGAIKNYIRATSKLQQHYGRSGRQLLWNIIPGLNGGK